MTATNRAKSQDYWHQQMNWKTRLEIMDTIDNAKMSERQYYHACLDKLYEDKHDEVEALADANEAELQAILNS